MDPETLLALHLEVGSLEVSELKVGDVITELDTLGCPSHISVFVGEHNHYPSVVHAVGYPYYCVMVTRLKPPEAKEVYTVHRYHNENVACLAAIILLIWHVNKVEYQLPELREKLQSFLETEHRITLDLDHGEKQSAVASQFFEESISKLIQMASHLFYPILPMHLETNLSKGTEELEEYLEELSLQHVKADDSKNEISQHNLTAGMRCGEAVTAAFNIAQMIFDEALITEDAAFDEAITKLQYAIVANYWFNFTKYGDIETMLSCLSFPFLLGHHYVTASSVHFHMHTESSRWLPQGQLSIPDLKHGEDEVVSKQEWKKYCALLKETAPKRQATALLEYTRRALTRDMAHSPEGRSQSAIDFIRGQGEIEGAAPFTMSPKPKSARGERSQSFTWDEGRSSPCAYLNELMISTNSIHAHSPEVIVPATAALTSWPSSPQFLLTAFSPSPMVKAPLTVATKAKHDVKSPEFKLDETTSLKGALISSFYTDIKKEKRVNAMRRVHSNLYLTDGLISTINVGDYQEHRLNGKKLRELLVSEEPLDYGSMADLLREVNDAQFNIISTAVVSASGEAQWLRDATQALPLQNRMPHGAAVIEANNVLLRTLSRLRPIVFAVNKKWGNTAVTMQTEIRMKFAEVCERILMLAEKSDLTNEAKIKALEDVETQFNTFLIQKLHEADLTEGCESAKDAEKLLFHYRNLSSVLTPTRTMITLTYDTSTMVLQRETQYPVTQKTQEQQLELLKLRDIEPYCDAESMSAHNRLSIAQQEADSLFTDLMASNDTALPAQTRKTHLVGAKNAFVVKNELMPIDDAAILDNPLSLDALIADKDNVLWLARMGSPVYVGLGESQDRVQLHAREALEQVRATASEKMGLGTSHLKLHVSTLNTYTFLENQATIVRHIAAATRENTRNQDDYSYLPSNTDGTCRFLDIAKGLNFSPDGSQPCGSAPLAKAKRLQSISKVVRAASRAANTLSVIHCASGQDRTGTAVEKSTRDWMHGRYLALGKSPIHIDDIRTRGGNAAEITTHHVHGSPGMKEDSIANNLIGGGASFSQASTRELYRKSANTNKKNKVGEVQFLTLPTEKTVQSLEAHLKSFKAELMHCAKKQPSAIYRELYHQGHAMLKSMKAIIGDSPQAANKKDLFDVIQVLSCATQTLRDIEHQEKTKQHIKALSKLSLHVSGKGSAWKQFGLRLCIFSCLALMCIGILAAIPSGGSSLLLTWAGAAGLSLASTAVITGGIASSLVVGAGLFAHGQEKGVAKALSKFTCALQEKEKEDIKRGLPNLVA